MLVYKDRSILKGCIFEEEEWLEKYGYAMGEDQVLFYKLCIYGYKTVCVTNLKLEHLDAGTSTGGNVERTAFGAGWFKSVFWKRFIYDREKNRVLKVVDKIAFFYCFYIIAALAVCGRSLQGYRYGSGKEPAV